MHFYSDFSSGSEEEADQDREIWNPNDVIDEIRNTDNVENKQRLKKELLESFLDQDRPLLTSKMKDFLLDEGVAEGLVSFVTRVNETNNNNPQRDTTQENEDAIRRSFNVMEIFLNPMNDLDGLLHEKLPVLLQELFKIFDKSSVGNFYHFSKIVEQILLRVPVEATTILVQDALLWIMLDFTHEPAIVDTLISTFCCKFPKQSDAMTFYKLLVEHKVFEKLGNKIYSPGQIGALPTAEFFVKLIEKLSSIEMSGILFISLCKTSTFMDKLFQAITLEDPNTFSNDQKLACASVLRELLLKSGERMFEQADFSRPLPNMLSAIHDKLHEYAKTQIVALCEIIIASDGGKGTGSLYFSAYTVKRPLGFFRFYLTEILRDIVITSPEVIEKMPGQIWRVLTTWFVEYSHNNLYHFQFYKIFHTVVRGNFLEPQKLMLNKYKFLSKIIEHYKSKEISDARGHIIQICNVLRLSAELQPPSGWLRHYLLSHDAWKQFLPTLRTDTLTQLKRYNDVSRVDEEEDEDDGIDLGSAYARYLGFEEGPPVQDQNQQPSTPKAKKKKPKKKKGKGLKDSSDGSGKEDEEDTKTETKPVKEEDKPEPTPEWWSDMVQEFQKEEKPDPSASTDWWAEMKKELAETEAPSSKTTTNQ